MNKSKEEESKRIKEISVDILKEFIRICDKYELNWFVAYGTAIGTVRHQERFWEQSDTRDLYPGMTIWM